MAEKKVWLFLVGMCSIVDLSGRMIELPAKRRQAVAAEPSTEENIQSYWEATGQYLWDAVDTYSASQKDR